MNARSQQSYTAAEDKDFKVSKAIHAIIESNVLKFVSMVR